MRVDQAAAERFLRERYRSAVGAVAAITQQGVWSNAYSFMRDANRYVIRFTPYREDLERDRFAAHFVSAALPIPPVLDIGEAFEGHYAVTPYIEGRHLDTLDERAVRATMPSLFAAIDALRRIDLSTFSGFGGWNGEGHGEHTTWRGWLLDVRHERDVRGLPPWRVRMAHSSTGTAPFDRAFEVFASLVERCPDERHLVHNDLLHYNVLVADGRVTAVLDWGSSIYGDFLYDLAKLAFFTPWYPAWSAIDFAREGAAFYTSMGVALPAFETRLRCYEMHIGLEHQAWYASRGEWSNLEKAARRTLALAEGV